MTGLREWGESAARTVLERVGRGVSRVQERKPLPYDLLESDDAYLVVFDAPGAARSDIQVRFVEGQVEVRIDRFRDYHEGFEMRFPGRGLTLSGDADLPEDASVDASDASATLASNGTLRVRIPRVDEGHDVEVTEGDDAEMEDESDGPGRDVEPDDARIDDVETGLGGAEPSPVSTGTGTKDTDDEGATTAEPTDPTDSTSEVTEGSDGDGTETR